MKAKMQKPKNINGKDKRNKSHGAYNIEKNRFANFSHADFLHTHTMT